VKNVVAFLLLAVIAACGNDQTTQRGLLLDASGHVQLELAITIADTEYERQEGLRLHGPLSENSALLLVFPIETKVCITNTGVPFPIDLLFLSASQEVIASQEHIPANATGPYCHPNTAMVLELQGDALQPLNYAKLELF
jgi:uncharacterized membrane protein (UPF0127 family)